MIEEIKVAGNAELEKKRYREYGVCLEYAFSLQKILNNVDEETDEVLTQFVSKICEVISSEKCSLLILE